MRQTRRGGQRCGWRWRHARRGWTRRRGWNAEHGIPLNTRACSLVKYDELSRRLRGYHAPSTLSKHMPVDVLPEC